jgi:hypothetical protein
MVRQLEYIKPETNATYPLVETDIIWDTESDRLKADNIALRDILLEMDTKIAELEKRVPKEQVLVLRDIPVEQARNEIRRLFKKGGIYYYSDVVQKLRLDLETVVEICNDLREKGELEDANIH